MKKAKQKAPDLSDQLTPAQTAPAAQLLLDIPGVKGVVIYTINERWTNQRVEGNFTLNQLASIKDAAAKLFTDHLQQAEELHANTEPVTPTTETV